jgi:hypothetical protein
MKYFKTTVKKIVHSCGESLDDNTYVRIASLEVRRSGDELIVSELHQGGYEQRAKFRIQDTGEWLCVSYRDDSTDDYEYSQNGVDADRELTRWAYRIQDEYI